MTDWELNRRKLLALFGVTGASTLSYQAYLASLKESDGQQPSGTSGTETPTPGDLETEEGTEDTGPRVADIRNYGAAIDGETNDAPAIRQAMEDIRSGGTVFLPSGEILIDTPEDSRGAITLTDDHKSVRFIGAVGGDEGTTLRMASGQEDVHYAFFITGDTRSPDDQIVLGNLSINLTSSEQETVGTAVRTNSANGKLKLRNCTVTSTRNSGVKMVGGMDGDIQDCAFKNNGVDSFGHAVSPNQSQGQTKTVIKNVVCTDQRGASIDVGLGEDKEHQTVEIESCVLKDSLAGVKINPTAASVTVRNTSIIDSSEIPIKMNPYEYHMGEVVLENLLIDGGGWPGVDFPNPTALEMRNVAIKNVDKNNVEREHTRGGIRTDQVDFGSSGRISIHNVGRDNDGPALKLFEGSGSIEEVRHSGTDGLGQTGGVSVGQNVQTDEPLEPDVPSTNDIGPNKYSS